MKSYFSISPATGKPSGIVGYEYGDDYITVYFKRGLPYTYTVESCGAHHIDTMKQLADAQHGLNTYLTFHKPTPSKKG